MTPADVRTAIGAAIRHHRSGRLDEARRLYQRVLAADPDQADALNLLGMIDHAGGDPVLARARIERAIAIDPHVPGYHGNLGTVLLAQGDGAAAVAAFRAAVALKPDHAVALYNLGRALQATGAIADAATAYRDALRVDPRLRDAWNNLGNCQAGLGETDAAFDSFRRAVAIDPHCPEAHVNAAGLLDAIGEPEQAERVCRAIIARHPDHAEAHNRLGLTMVGQNRGAEAITAFEAAVAIRPDDSEALLNLANALFDGGSIAEATAHYRALIDRSPDDAAPRLGLAVSRISPMPADAAESAQIPARFSQALAELAGWSAGHPGALGRAAGRVQPFFLAYRPADVTAPLAHYGRLICAEIEPSGRPPTITAPAIVGRSRIRLGIVSGHVRDHPVWQIILRGLIAHIDRSRFDIRLYNSGRRSDGETQWADRHVDHHKRHGLGTRFWVEHIRREAPDILLFPELGMDPISAALAAQRLAPLQAASWGHPVTSGLPSIDLYLSGEALEPPKAAAHYTETLVRLPGTGVHTQFDGTDGRRWTGPQRRAGCVRFALCHQPMKFDPAYDPLYAAIARHVGDCEFWLCGRPDRHGRATG